MQPGSIVQCRNRHWVLLPDEDPERFALRPLTGAADELTYIHKRLSQLIGYDLPGERLTSGVFPAPKGDELGDAVSTRLLWQAARLSLREGATPFRSLGKISIRPRTYQFVPLLMALRLDPVRLLIADDVGVGKTVEALLIARELLDRGEVRQLCVLCPPYLCDQWQKELAEKFNLDSVVIRSGTVGQLDRQKPQDKSIYQHFRVQVVSIDFAKTKNNSARFIQDCPRLVIVDESHGAAESERATQQQRHKLLRALAADNERHLILLTATPHSGVENAFRSLLGLLKPEFANYETGRLNDEQRAHLARHFVQRTRRNIEDDWENDHCFPKRLASDETYPLSPEYRALFERTYAFCAELIRAGESLTERKQRVHYWTALALLRCIMSSPAAAVATLAKRAGFEVPTDDDGNRLFSGAVFESDTDATDDNQPIALLAQAEAEFAESERRELRNLGKLAAGLLTRGDEKLRRCAALVEKLIADGFHPIIWCRYIATAEYVGAALQKHLGKNVRVAAVTGTLSDDERRAKIAEFDPREPHVLVATDCLSEGVNLQEFFNAALHYDLPWNPNRLEQREGRVDRYGQQGRVDRAGKRHREVKAIRFFSTENPVDGVVIRVLLDKAREIYAALGTHVPVPEESESVTQAVLKALFFRAPRADSPQMELGLEVPEVVRFHRQLDLDARREKENRTRFAQRSIKPDEVRRELEATDAVLGDPDAVRTFVLNAAQRVGLTIQPDKAKDVFRVLLGGNALATVPRALHVTLPTKATEWRISFISPTPEGATYLGRNHRFVATLAQFLMEEALIAGEKARAPRCGAILTKGVKEPTTLLLLRVRYLVEIPARAPLLAEEAHVLAFVGEGKKLRWLDDDAPLRLLADVEPAANLTAARKAALVAPAIAAWGGKAFDTEISARLTARATALADAHRRIRQAVSLRVRELTVKPQLPPDLLGVLLLQPAD